MPEVHFTIQLPNGEQRECYSPSTVIKKFFHQGEELPVSDFVARSREALAEASERVRQKFGYSCSSASAQLADIEQFTRPFAGQGTVRILSI